MIERQAIASLGLAAIFFAIGVIIFGAEVRSVTLVGLLACGAVMGVALSQAVQRWRRKA